MTLEEKKLSVTNCIEQQLEGSHSAETKIWLEGWICGVTDPWLGENEELQSWAMDKLNKIYS